MATAKLDDNIVDLDQRVENLEARNAFQDDVIEQLNKEITIHQAEIANLKENIQFIAKRLKDVTPTNTIDSEVEPPPPHY